MTETPKEASKLGQFSWALFDWANQPFFTIVTTFIFAPYFANVMVGDPVAGQSAWAFTQSTSGILIALMSLALVVVAGALDTRHRLSHRVLVGRLTIVVALNLALVVSIDRPFSGGIKVSGAPLREGVLSRATHH